MLIFRHMPLHTLQRTWGYAYVQISVSLRKWHFFNIYQGCACQIYLLVRCICTSNHMCKKEIWDKFTEFTFLKKKKKISRVKRERFQNFKNERGQFSPNFTNKHVIPGKSHVTTSQRAHKRKNYAKNNQSISANLINLTP